jgi:hypothetical protein
LIAEADFRLPEIPIQLIFLDISKSRFSLPCLNAFPKTFDKCNNMLLSTNLFLKQKYNAWNFDMWEVATRYTFGHLRIFVKPSGSLYYCDV